MQTEIFIVKLCVRLRQALEGPEGVRIVGYFRDHWVEAANAELALGAAVQEAKDGVADLDSSEVESAGASIEVKGKRLRAEAATAPRVLHRSGRILFPED